MSCAQTLLLALDALTQETSDECAAVAWAVDSVDGVKIVEQSLRHSGVEQNGSSFLDDDVMCFRHVLQRDASDDANRGWYERNFMPVVRARVVRIRSNGHQLADLNISFEKLFRSRSTMTVQ